MSVLIIIVFNFSLSPVLWLDAHLHWFFSRFIWRYSIRLTWHQVFPIQSFKPKCTFGSFYWNLPLPEHPEKWCKNRPGYNASVSSPKSFLIQNWFYLNLQWLDMVIISWNFRKICFSLITVPAWWIWNWPKDETGRKWPKTTDSLQNLKIETCK